VDVERGCGNIHILWTPSTIQCLNDPRVSTLCSPWWSVFFLHEDVVVLTRLTTRSPIVRCIHFCVWWIFSWIEAATFLTGQFAAEWYIRIWIWCENQTLWLKCHSLSLTFYTAVTFRDDVVPYYGACRSISRTLTVCWQWSRWLTFIAVMVGDSKDHLWEMTLDTSSAAIGTIGLDRVFLYLAFLHYVVVWRFQRYIFRTGVAGDL